MEALAPLLKIFEGLPAATLPLFAFLLWSWWAERNERLALTDKLWVLVQSSVAAENAMAQSLDVLSAKIK